MRKYLKPLTFSYPDEMTFSFAHGDDTLYLDFTFVGDKWTVYVVCSTQYTISNWRETIFTESNSCYFEDLTKFFDYYETFLAFWDEEPVDMAEEIA